jgi:acetyl-CoA synthetase
MIWEPSRAFIERTNAWRFMQRLGFDDREAFLAFSRQNPERFWDELMREMGVAWFEPYSRVLDDSRGPEWAQWFTGGRLNIAYNCLDRWAESDPARTACLWEGENGDTRSITFSELRREASRIARGLVNLGLEPGDRVALVMPMVPEILGILYGCLQAGLTVVPIFAGFGAGAIATRLEDSGARALFTAPHLVRRGKQLPLAEKIPPLVEHTLVLPEQGGFFAGEEDAPFPTLSLESETRALILYTSGTTGKPKGAIHTHGGCLAQMGKEIWLGFDHRDSDRFFWLSDIGWMMGPWTILGNHLFGGTIFLYDGAPDYPGPTRLWEMILRHGITTFGVSPTAIRVLAKYSGEVPAMDTLRLLGSTGEPWDDASWLWFFERVGRRRCPIIPSSR